MEASHEKQMRSKLPYLKGEHAAGSKTPVWFPGTLRSILGQHRAIEQESLWALSIHSVNTFEHWLHYALSAVRRSGHAEIQIGPPALWRLRVCGEEREEHTYLEGKWSLVLFSLFVADKTQQSVPGAVPGTKWTKLVMQSRIPSF